MNNLIEVKYISSKKGRGLFAKQLIKKGTSIDIANVILIPNNDYESIKKTVLYDYCYIWEDPKLKPEYKNAISLSISQFMNHSYEPNVKYVYDYKNRTIEYITLRNIPKGEELTVNYNGLINDKSPVWFTLEQ
jgi:SET domain-containing protein